MRALKAFPQEPENLSLVDIATPRCAADEVLVEVAATAVDRVDTFIRHGTHGMGETGTIDLGRDLAGVVTDVGSSVRTFKPGDRVMATGSAAHAEYAVAPADFVVPVPIDWSLGDAAALLTPGRTAYAAVVELACVKPGDRVLVVAAGGGVGSCVVQLCHLIGAEVVATVGAEWKKQHALKIGADHVYRHDEPGWGKLIQEELGSVSAIVDTVGNATWPEALSSLASNGSIVCCGVSSGHQLSLHLGRLMTRGWRLLGIGRPSREVVAEHMRAVVQMYADGGIRPHVYESFALDEASSAYALLENSAFFGRILLRPLEEETYGHVSL